MRCGFDLHLKLWCQGIAGGNGHTTPSWEGDFRFGFQNLFSCCGIFAGWVWDPSGQAVGEANFASTCAALTVKKLNCCSKMLTDCPRRLPIPGFLRLPGILAWNAFWMQPWWRHMNSWNVRLTWHDEVSPLWQFRAPSLVTYGSSAMHFMATESQTPRWAREASCMNDGSVTADFFSKAWGGSGASIGLLLSG